MTARLPDSSSLDPASFIQYTPNESTGGHRITCDMSALVPAGMWKTAPTFVVEVDASGRITTDAPGLPAGFGADPEGWLRAHRETHVIPRRSGGGNPILGSVAGRFTSVAEAVVHPQGQHQSLWKAIAESQNLGPAFQNHGRWSPLYGNSPIMQKAVALHLAMQDAVEPHLDQEAVALVGRVHQGLVYAADQYEALAGRPHLQELVSDMPVTGLFLNPEIAARIPASARPADAVGMLLSQPRPATMKAPAGLPPISAGFLAWARGARFERAEHDVNGPPMLAFPHNNPSGTRDMAVELAMMGPALSPALVGNLQSRDDWEEFHELAATPVPALGLLFLRDPMTARAELANLNIPGATSQTKTRIFARRVEEAVPKHSATREADRAALAAARSITEVADLALPLRLQRRARRAEDMALPDTEEEREALREFPVRPSVTAFKVGSLDAQLIGSEADLLMHEYILDSDLLDDETDRTLLATGNLFAFALTDPTTKLPAGTVAVGLNEEIESMTVAEDRYVPEALEAQVLTAWSAARAALRVSGARGVDELPAAPAVLAPIPLSSPATRPRTGR
jgi:hypothetical protein